MKRLLFIYNPHAGKELLKPKLSDIVDIFVKAGYEVVIYPTQAYQDAYKKVRRYPAGEYDLVVCSGGDGTIDEVVTGMMKRQEKNPIGYIPTGTTNDFANSPVSYTHLTLPIASIFPEICWVRLTMR